MARAILFGYEGGLVDLSRARFRALEAALADEGIELSPEILAGHPFGAPYERWVARVIEHVRDAPAESLPARLMARAAAGYRAGLRRDGPEWVEGAVEFVNRAAATLDLGVVATVPRQELDDALRRVDLEGSLRVVVAGEDLASAGAGSSPYLVAMIHLNTQAPLPERLIHPHEVVALEGTAEGARAAAAAGLTTVAIGEQSPAAEFAELVVEGFDALDLGRLGSG